MIAQRHLVSFAFGRSFRPVLIQDQERLAATVIFWSDSCRSIMDRSWKGTAVYLQKLIGKEMESRGVTTKLFCLTLIKNVWKKDK